ncbi:MAG: porin [Pseudomonadota bacterium]|nr:porin [Pseudomonadota bacterium]
MKKTILATAIAAAVMAAPMTAAANVVLYGKIHASIDYVDPSSFDFDHPIFDGIDDLFDTDGTWSVTNRTSRIGFKGSEDLGNGLKAIWKAEIGYNLDGTDGGGWGGGRNSYIGLAGDWGTVLMGKHDTPLKISTGRLDVFADTMADYNTTVGFVDRRTPNTIAYISPNWNGFTFAIAGVATEVYGDSLVGDGAWSVAAMYFNNGFYGSVAYEDAAGSDGKIGDGGYIPLGAVDDNKVARVGLGYIMNAFTFGVVYERQTVNAALTGFEDQDIDKWQVLGAYDFGNNTVKAMFGQYDPDDGGTVLNIGSSRNAWAIGWDHKLSVRTKVYALYADSEIGLHNHTQKISTNDDGSLNSLPIYDAQGFSMGMVHTF